MQQLKAMGIKQVLSTPNAPRQRAYIERLIGTSRRELLYDLLRGPGRGRYGKEFGGYHLADVVVQEGPPGLVRQAAERAEEARDSALGNGDTEHLEFTMNFGGAPQRIGGDHLCDQSAEFCGGAGATSAPAPRLGKPSPESPEPLELPSHNSVWLDVEQRLAPVALQSSESNPKHPVRGRHQRAPSLSLKGGDLHS